ncbi:MAG TPA: glycosyltransferase 87 family protein, partial [Actinomycetota bacterium]|nr:glycosyltransferase 87 family protein [Actinomycetota bacterium]
MSSGPKGGPQAPPASLWLALAATGLGLTLAYLLKGQCALHPWADNFQYRHLCYNDIQPLYGVRGISKGLLPYRDVMVEYPVLTGMFMDLCGRVLRALVRLDLIGEATDGAYLALTSLLLAPCAIAVTLLLRPRVTRARLMIWAVGTPMVLYAFHNWDLLAVAAAVWGLVAFERKRNGTAGAALAAGASAKLYPAFLMPGAVLARWSTGDRRGATRAVLMFLAVYVAINVPWLVISSGDPPARQDS